MNSILGTKGRLDRIIRRVSSLVLCVSVVSASVLLLFTSKDSSFEADAVEYIEPMLRVGLRLMDDANNQKPYSLTAPDKGFQFGTMNKDNDLFVPIGNSTASELTASVDVGYYIKVTALSDGNKTYQDGEADGVIYLNTVISAPLPDPEMTTESYYRIGPYESMEAMEEALATNIPDALLSQDAMADLAPIIDGECYYLRMVSFSAGGEDCSLADDGMLETLQYIFSSYEVQIEYHTDCTYIIGPYDTEEVATEILKSDVTAAELTKLGAEINGNVASTEGKYYIHISSLTVNGEENVSTSDAIEVVRSVFYGGGACNATVGYHDGFCFAVGPYTSAVEADFVAKNALHFQFLSAGATAAISVSETTQNGVALTDQDGNPIFSFSTSDITLAMAVKPIDLEEAFISVEGYQYIETIEFRGNYDTDEKKQILGVITVLPIEKYVACVCGYEIFGSWSVGTHEAFSILVRTYSVQNIQNGSRKHSSDFSDICKTSCCQVYRGNARISENILQAVKNTKGLVLSKDNQIMPVYYSAISGGSTLSLADCWGGFPNDSLVAVPSPWERYKEYTTTSYGEWQKEFTGKELYNLVKSRVKELKGEIVDVEITQYGENSGHVYMLTMTDIYGNKGTLTTGQAIRSALGLTSVCFCVGKNGETVSYPEYSLDCFPSIYSEGYSGYGEYYKYADEQTKVLAKDGSISSLLGHVQYALINALGELEYFDLPSVNLKVLTANGNVTVNEDGLPDILNGKTVVKTRTMKLSGTDGKFIFAGKGWGHGVGVPQYAIRDMAMLGYDYETILKYYVRNVEIVNLNDLGIQ